MITIISTTKTNTVGNGESQQPALDKTGQFAVFASDSTNLSSDTSGLSAIYLKNTQTGDLQAISNDKYGIAANTASLNPSVSRDGHYVTFESTAVVSTDFNGSILFPSFSDFNSTSQTNKGGVNNVFLKDTQTGALTLVTPTFGDDNSTNSQITQDGRYVVFESAASNFVSNDTNGAYDIYVEDLQSKTLKLVSSDASGTEGNRASLQPSLSADGSKVAFASDADNFLGFDNVTKNLNASPSTIDGNWSSSSNVPTNNINVSVPVDNNANRDVFVKNINTNAIQLVSANYKGGAANGVSDSPSISADGTKVVFRSFATNLIANLINATRDGSSYIYLKDLQTNTLTQVDLLNDGTLPNGSSLNPTISPDGKYVAFISDATNLVSNDNNGVADVFVKNLSTGELKLISDSSTGTGDVTSIAFSGDSSTLAFSRLSGLEDNATTNVYSVMVNPNSPHTGIVTIGGTPTSGQTLTAVTDSLKDADGLGTFNYQWLSNNTPIQGATQSSYALNSNDVGQTIAVKVSFTDGKGNFETETSKATTVAKADLPVVKTADTHAKVYFNADDSFVVTNSGVTAYGSSGDNDMVTVIAGSQGLLLDSNVDALAFVSATSAGSNNSIAVTAASIGNYTFKSAGTNLQIYNSKGNALLASIGIQDDNNGTLLNFSEGVFSAKFAPTATGLSIQINGITVSSSSANPMSVNATSSTTTPLTNVLAISSSSVFLNANDPITVSNDGIKVFGGMGNETVTLTQTAKNVVLDQNVEHLVFQKNESDYKFAQAGNAIKIYDGSATSIIASIPVQDNGTILTFNDGETSVTLSPTSSGLNMLLGNFVLKSTPMSPVASIDIKGAGVDDAANGNKTFFVYAGNYNHEIKNFQSGDIINFPVGQTPTINNSDIGDGKADLQYANNGQLITITLTGLVNDASLFGIASFKTVFGSASIGSF